MWIYAEVVKVWVLRTSFLEKLKSIFAKQISLLYLIHVLVLGSKPNSFKESGGPSETWHYLNNEVCGNVW